MSKKQKLMSLDEINYQEKIEREEKERERDRLKRIRTLIEPYSVEFKDKKSQYQYNEAMNKDMFHTWKIEENEYNRQPNMEDLDLDLEKMRLRAVLARNRKRMTQDEIDKKQKEIDDFYEENFYRFDGDNVRVVDDSFTNLFSSKKPKKTKRSTRKKIKKRKVSRKNKQ